MEAAIIKNMEMMLLFLLLVLLLLLLPLLIKKPVLACVSQDFCIIGKERFVEAVYEGYALELVIEKYK